MFSAHRNSAHFVWTAAVDSRASHAAKLNATSEELSCAD
jgi:hypothetical protein